MGILESSNGQGNFRRMISQLPGQNPRLPIESLERRVLLSSTIGSDAGLHLAVDEAGPAIEVPNAAVSTTTTLTSSSNPIQVGQTLNLMAQVTSASGSPAGTVTFFDGTTKLGTATINSFTSQAMLSLSTLTVGVHNLTATYNGATGFAGSTSNVLSQTINPTGTLTNTTLVSSLNPSVAGQTVALTATVTAPAGGVPNGTVNLFDGSTFIGSATINTITNQAIAFTSTLTVGMHNLTAVYLGATAFAGSTSAVLTQTVNPVGVTTRTVVVASSNPIKFGQVVALTATVTANSGSPTGTVTFMDGSTVIGTVAINPATQQAVGFTNSLSIGTHNVTAVYSGAVGFAASTSPIIFVTVATAPAATTTTVIASANPVVAGTTVAFTATVSTASGSPTGNVTFFDGTTLIGTVILNSTTKQATAFTASLSVGTHSITAVYNGSGSFLLSTSAAISETINPAGVATKTTLTSSQNPTLTGQLIALVATVTSTGGMPIGNVTFFDGTSVIGSVAINPATQQAIGFTSFQTVGTHNLTAIYGGAIGFLTSTSAVVREVVNQGPISTATTLTTSANPVQQGQILTLTATVASATGTPTGTVTFLDGLNVIGGANINSLSGQATFTTSTLAVGVHILTAQYTGATGFLQSISSPVIETVNPVTITTLTSSANPIDAGKVLTLTATVTAPAGGIPSGGVRFMDGTTLIGSATINTLTNQAIISTSSLSVGVHTLTAVYTGAPAFTGSTSAPLSQTINPAGVTTRTTVVASSNPIKLGQVVALIATVTSNSGSPTGTVTFMDGSNVIGSVAINPATQQAIGFTGSLTLGTHNITAVYSGAVGFAPSTSSIIFVTVSQGPAVTNTTLVSSSNPVVAGQVIALVATVTSLSGGLPTGNVTFFDGTTIIGTVAINSATQQAIAFTNSLSVGTHNITAVYLGSNAFITSTSAILEQTVS